MSLPYFPLFPSDFEGKTSHLTLLEDGAYNRLLRICWMTPGCSLPNDEAWIFRRARAMTQAEQEAIRSVLAEFFTVSEGRVSNARLTKEWLAANEAHERRKNAGQKGGKAKALKSNNSASSNAVALSKQPEPEPEPKLREETDVSSARVAVFQPKDRFEDFWCQYPHRGGAKKGRAKAHDKWKRHVRAGVSQQDMIAGAMRYAEDRQVVQGYAKDPTTWLNQKGWEDEIERHHDRGADARAHATDRSIAIAASFARTPSRDCF